jgi:HlyD family secretion protein
MIMGVLVVAAISAGAWWGWRQQNPANGPLALSGNVEVRQVNLGFKVSGRITRLMADEGQRVEEGEVLGSLEKSYFEDSLAQARAQLSQAAAILAKLEAGNRPEEIGQAEAAVAERETTLVNAQQTLARAKHLLQNSAGTQKAYDDALSASREAEARLNSARQDLKLQQAGSRKEDIDAARAQLAERAAAVTTAERQLADADLKVPSPGVVLSRVREVGAIVNAGETVFVLTLVSPVWVRSYVSEVDLGRVKAGMPVDIRTDTPGAGPFVGHIGFISTTAEFTPKTVETRELRTALVYRLRIVVDDPEGVLKQGMPVTVTASELPSPHSDPAMERVGKAER